MKQRKLISRTMHDALPGLAIDKCIEGINDYSRKNNCVIISVSHYTTADLSNMHYIVSVVAIVEIEE